MDTALNRQHLELTVSNFGPIAEGRIELRPMTVFVGPSNTGKSYLAILTYALHRVLGAYSDAVTYGRRRFSERASDHFPTRELTENAAAEVLDWVSEVQGEITHSVSRGRIRRELPEPIEVPEAVSALIRAEIRNSTLLGEALNGEIARCFGVEQVGDLSSHPSSVLTQFSIRGSRSETSGNRGTWEYNFAVSDQTVTTEASVPLDMPLHITRHFSLPRYLIFRRWLEDDSVTHYRRAAELLEVLAGNIMAGMTGPLNRSAYYLPADRSGVMHAHHVVVRALIANASRGGIRHQAPLPVLSGVLGDFLDELLEMASRPSVDRRHGSGLAASLEKTLIKGGINVYREEVDYPSFVYRPEGWDRDLPLMNASSMVSELAPVALYLRNVVREGDTLIIEEPESHLHPEMQVAFVRELAAAVKAGIRVIITTHSEWVLEELANLALLSELPPERREGIEGADVALSPEEFGAWLFEPGKDGSGSTVSEMPLDKDLGNFQSGFALVTEDTYNRWARIFNRIEDCNQWPQP